MGEVVKLSSPHKWVAIREYDAAECCGHFITLAQADEGSYAVLIIGADIFEVIGNYPATPEGLQLATLAADIADTTLAMHTFIQPAA